MLRRRRIRRRAHLLRESSDERSHQANIARAPIRYAPVNLPANHDMANVSPHLPPSSRSVSDTSRIVIGSLAVALGGGMFLTFLIQFLLNLETAAFAWPLAGELAGVLAAGCFLASGVTILMRSAIGTTELLVGGLVFVLISRIMG